MCSNISPLAITKIVGGVGIFFFHSCQILSLLEINKIVFGFDRWWEKEELSKINAIKEIKGLERESILHVSAFHGGFCRG